MSRKTDYFVIMGATVSPDGTPSKSLLRRVDAALGFSAKSATRRFLVTGGSHGEAPTEASVMRRLLRESGIPDQIILTEDESVNTLSSVRNCVRMLRLASDVSTVTICTDRYHAVRSRILFWLFGVRTQQMPIPDAHVDLGLKRWLYYLARECMAIPVDLLLGLLWRARNGRVDN